MLENWKTAPVKTAKPASKKRNSLPRIERDKLNATHLKQVIRDLGLKVTHQRLTILEKLLKGRAHITAQELYETVSETDSSLGFATVYRFLRSLSENGFVTEVRMKGLPARYEWADKTHHDHLSCIECGAIREFENQEIENLQAKIANDLGFMLTDHILELYGVCSACQKKGTKETAGEVMLPRRQTRHA